MHEPVIAIYQRRIRDQILSEHMTSRSNKHESRYARVYEIPKIHFELGSLQFRSFLSFSNPDNRGGFEDLMLMLAVTLAALYQCRQCKGDGVGLFL